MQVGLFLRNKISRQIALNGRQFQFDQVGTDKYNQKNKVLGVYTVCGIYHESVTYVKVVGETSSRARNKPEPMLLLLKEDADKVSVGDMTMISGKRYRVNDKHNVQNLDVAYDVSLEVNV